MRALTHGYIFVVALAVLPMSAAADDPVLRFTRLEEAWTQAIQLQDRSKIEPFLTPEYSLTVGVPGRLLTVSRALWLENAVTSYVIHDFKIRDLAVKEYGDLAVVTFVMSANVTVDGADSQEEFFLTDVWVRTHGRWQVAARYSSRPHEK